MTNSPTGTQNPGPFMELPNWESRNPSIAAMLNPALISVSLAAAAIGHGKYHGEPMPWEYSFLIAPMVLHRATRTSVPGRIDTYLPNWVSNNPLIHAGLAPRARAMAPYVREGFRFGLSNNVLLLRSDGTFNGALHGKLPQRGTGELREIIKTSRFLGRWFSNVGTPATVFAVLGMTP